MSALGQKRTSRRMSGLHVRFTPESGHWSAARACPLSGNSGRRGDEE